jgi:hypothetical protein
VALGRQAAFAVGVTIAGAIFAIRERAYMVGYPVDGAGADVARAQAIAEAFGDTMLAGVALAVLAAVFSLAVHRPATSVHP